MIESIPHSRHHVVPIAKTPHEIHEELEASGMHNKRSSEKKRPPSKKGAGGAGAATGDSSQRAHALFLKRTTEINERQRKGVMGAPTGF